MQLTSKSSEKRWKINTVFYQCSAQSIILSMQEDTVSSYNSKIQSRGRFKAKNRRVVKEILLGPVTFHRMPICAGGWVNSLIAYFFLIQKGHSQLQPCWKRGILHLLLRTARIQDKAGIKLFSKHMLALPVWNLPNYKIKGEIKSWRRSCYSSRWGNKVLQKEGLGTHVTQYGEHSSEARWKMRKSITKGWLGHLETKKRGKRTFRKKTRRNSSGSD